MKRSETVEEVVERSAELGLRATWDCGFLFVTRASQSDPRGDDDPELERSLIEQLSVDGLRYLRDLAVAKACGDAARNYIGRQIFLPGDHIFGRIEGSSADEITVSHFLLKPDGEPREHPSVRGMQGPSGFVLVPDGQMTPGSSPDFSSILSDGLRALLERTWRAGLSLELDNGLVLIKWPSNVSEEKVEALTRGLGRSILCMAEVRGFVIARAREARAKDFGGKRLFVPALGAFGILESCQSDGMVAVRYRDAHMDSEFASCFRADEVLILAGDIGAAAPEKPTAEDSESGWKRVLRRVFGV